MTSVISRHDTEIAGENKRPELTPEDGDETKLFESEFQWLISDDHHTRGNSRKLLVKRCHDYGLRKYFFSNRIVNIWNSLTDSVVMADTVV